jgi:membrane protein DedA with SNARE-associated domain
MAERGALAVFFGRIIPIIRAVISLVAGIGEMPFRRFFVSTSVATILYGTGVALIGYELGDNWHKIVKGFTYAGLIVGAVVVVLIILGVLHRLRTLRAERQSVG